MNDTYTPFQEAEKRFAALRSQLAAGQITKEQFQADLASLTLTDEKGAYWTIDPNTGGWVTFLNDAWASASPYPAPPPPQPPVSAASSPPAVQQTVRSPAAPQPAPASASSASKAAKGGSCLKKLGCGCLVLLLLLVLLAGGGYLAFTRGWIQPSTLLGLVGLAPAQVQVTNIADENLAVSIEALDEATLGYTVTQDMDLYPGDIGTYTLEKGRYTLSFLFVDSGQSLNCTIQAKSGDQYHFMSYAADVFVTRRDKSDPAGISITQSGFCIP